VVRHSNTVVDPNAMVIKLGKAHVAQRAMLRSCRLEQVAGVALLRGEYLLVPLVNLAQVLDV